MTEQLTFFKVLPLVLTLQTSLDHGCQILPMTTGGHSSFGNEESRFLAL